MIVQADPMMRLPEARSIVSWSGQCIAVQPSSHPEPPEETMHKRSARTDTIWK